MNEIEMLYYEKRMVCDEKQFFLSLIAVYFQINLLNNGQRKLNSNNMMISRLLKIAIFFFVITNICQGQGTTKFTQLDQSPMDMIYYPVDYPKLKTKPTPVTEPLIARIIYSRPQKMGRKVFGDLVEDGKIWRLGANEATEIEFFREVKIGNKKLKKGRYTLFALENKTEWTLIFNTELDTWGTFNYYTAKDVLRVTCNVQKTSEPIEAFSMQFEKINAQSCQLLIGWDDVMVALPISW